MPKVIINSTPIIILGNMDRLDLLQKIYGDVCIPEAVYNEVLTKKDSACQKVQQAGWIHVESVKASVEKRMFKAKLHEGEVEVMLLALEEPSANLVVLDDDAAKRTAKFLGLTVTGTLGVLLKAKKMGFVSEIRPLLDQMKMMNFFINEKIEKLVLAQAGET